MKFDFKMVGNLCVYDGTTLAAVLREHDEPESVPEDERKYVLWLLRRNEGGKIVPLEGTVAANGREFEMVHETLAFMAGALEDVLEDEHDEDEIEDSADRLLMLARLLGG
jgi:hypothetical protein